MINFRYDGIRLTSIATALPANKIQNSPEISAALAIEEQTSSDLGFLAAQEIFKNHNINKEEIGALVFLTKTPDYRGPATAMVLQNRLQIPQNCIVYDAPTGNGGFENALNIGASLLNSSHKNFVLLVLGDTISKQLSIQDFKTLNFQDGATAILLEKCQLSSELSVAILTKSKFWNSFIVPSGGFRENKDFFETLESKRVNQNIEHLHINEVLLEEAIVPEFDQLIQKVEEFINLHKNKKSLIFINLLFKNLEKIFKSKLIDSNFVMNNIFFHSEICPQTMAATNPIMFEIVLDRPSEIQNHIVSISLGEGLSLNIASFLTHKSILNETIYSDICFDNGFVTHEM